MFKVGDRVVYLSKKTEQFKEFVGLTFTIVGIFEPRENQYRVKENEKFVPLEENLVLEEVYNSPLYKVLKEETDE